MNECRGTILQMISKWLFCKFKGKCEHKKLRGILLYPTNRLTVHPSVRPSVHMEIGHLGPLPPRPLVTSAPSHVGPTTTSAPV